ncbi:TPA: ABC-three component system protein, partial [Escherichia coli]
GFQEQREQLLFSSIFEPLNDIIKNQNKKHWEFFCKRSFENTYSEYIEFLNENIEANPENKDKFILRKNNLDKYRRDVLTKYSCSDLLSMLSPHQLNDNSLDVFYSKICNQHLLRTVFLKFVQELSESGSDLVIKDKSSLAYHPSTITFIS